MLCWQVRVILRVVVAKLHGAVCRRQIWQHERDDDCNLQRQLHRRLLLRRWVDVCNFSGVSCRTVQLSRREQLHAVPRWHIWQHERDDGGNLQWQLHRWLLLLSWLDQRDCCRVRRWAVQLGRRQQLYTMCDWPVRCHLGFTNSELHSAVYRWQIRVRHWSDDVELQRPLHCRLLLSCWVDQRDGRGHVSCRAVQLGWCR